jgi:dolichol-phosphate mannosyltransferase
MTGLRVEVSVVVPVYNEAESIASLNAGLEEALSGCRHEIVVVDDGSTDASRDEIARFPAFRCVSIPHAGKSAALAAGIRAARGDTIVTIDADLQEDPSHLSRLLRALDEGAALACGCRSPRVDGLWRKRIPSAIYRCFLLALFGRRFHDINCGFRAARRDVWDSVTWFPGAHRLVPLLVALNGGAVAQIPVPHRPRQLGQAKFDSPLRFIDGIRDALMVRFGRIPRERRIRLQEKTIG